MAPRGLRQIVAAGVLAAALLGSLALAANAQVLDSKVTLSGFVDTVTTTGTNVFDSNFALKDDSAWITRNRGRFRLTADVEPLRISGVLEVEIDFLWGRVGADRASPAGFGLGGDFAVTSDLTGVTEIKNIYVEFPLPTPRWLPFTTARLGGQPFRTTLKPAVLATGDYGGVSLESEICGMWPVSVLCDDVRVSFTYAQLEEALAGGRGRPPAADRGDDFFTFLSLTYPMPIDRWGVRFIPRIFWGYLDAEGVTASAARCRTACAGLPLNGTDPPGTQPPAGAPASTTGNYLPGSNESRHYIGLDQNIEMELGRLGKIHIHPTAIYMRSTADVYGRPGVPATAPCGSDPDLRCPAGGPRQTNRVQSWLLDLRAGWFCYTRCLDQTWLGDVVRIGDGIHLEGLVMWTPGDASHHNLFRKNRVYHPITTDSDYLNGWNEILATGSVDYLTGNAHGMGENVGLGQYGRRQVGMRLTWDVWRYWDQSLSVHSKWSWVWTDQKVDTDAGSPAALGTGSFGNIPCAILEAHCRPGNNRRGDERYVGTETSLGLTYQFHRSLVFDVVGAYLFAGGALDSTIRQPDGTLLKRSAKDAQLLSARLRYRF